MDRNREIRSFEGKGKIHKVKIEAPLPKSVRNMSGEQALALSSAIPPTRLALTANYDIYVDTVQQIAIIMCNHMQQAGTDFQFASVSQTSINPSKVMAYLLGISAMHFTKIGAIVSPSNVFLTVGEYAVPTFFAKFLQQLSPSKHFGRQVCITFDPNVTVSTFLDTDCGTGGLRNNVSSALVPTPKVLPQDTEQYYAWGDDNSPSVSANGVSSQFNTISEAITKCFKSRCYVKDIPLVASSTELKCTPIAQTSAGMFWYTAIDNSKMCDLTLPLTAFLNPIMANSPGPAVLAAPIRVDCSLAACQPAKIAILFYLAQKNKWDPSDEFRTYLFRYQVPNYNMTSMQLNIRQINWVGVFQSAITYVQSIAPTTSPQQIWYFIVYCVCTIIASIPPALRCICPIQGKFDVSHMYPEIYNFPMYAGAYGGVKMPPFLAEIVSSVKRPTRTNNSINWFIASFPDSQVRDCWWGLAAYVSPGGFNNGGLQTNYGTQPMPIENMGMTWNGGYMYPYPGFTFSSVPLPGFVFVVKPYLPLAASAALSGWFQNNLSNNGQSVTNTWLTKCPKFTSRFSAYYIISELNNYKDVTNGQFFITYPTVKAKQISSWEPIGYHAALLASCHMLNYFLPLFPTDTTFASVFSATPNSTQAITIASAHVGSYAGQGTTAAIKAGTSKNPEEIVSHVGADAVSGLLQDSSQPVHEGVAKKATKKLQEVCASEPVKKGEAIVKKTSTLVQSGLKLIEDLA